jgi:hypothetical protein
MAAIRADVAFCAPWARVEHVTEGRLGEPGAAAQRRNGFLFLKETDRSATARVPFPIAGPRSATTKGVVARLGAGEIHFRNDLRVEMEACSLLANGVKSRRTRSARVTWICNSYEYAASLEGNRGAWVGQHVLHGSGQIRGLHEFLR